MYKGKKILGLIPARGGSKGIKNKNIIDLFGQPLISYSINSAKTSKYIDDIVVSTDDERIAKIAKKYGAEVPFNRPIELARDESKTIDAVLHAIDELKARGRFYDTLVLLQATQPLRLADDIDGAIELYYQNDERSLTSVSLVEDNPILVRTLSNGYELHNLIDMPSTCRRQDMPKYYKINGAIYINSIKKLSKETSFNDNEVGYVMPKSRSVDIDEVVDLWTAEFYLRAQNHCENI